MYSIFIADQLRLSVCIFIADQLWQSVCIFTVLQISSGNLLVYLSQISSGNLLIYLWQNSIILYIQVRFSYKSSVYSIHIIIYTIYQNHIGSVQHSLRDPALPDSCLMLLYGAVLACYMQLQVRFSHKFSVNSIHIYSITELYWFCLATSTRSCPAKLLLDAASWSHPSMFLHIKVRLSYKFFSVQYTVIVTTFIADQLRHSVRMFFAEQLGNSVTIFITDQLKQSVSMFIAEQLEHSLTIFITKWLKQSVSMFIAICNYIYSKLAQAICQYIFCKLTQAICQFVFADQLGLSVTIFILDWLGQSVSIFLQISSGYLVIYLLQISWEILLLQLSQISSNNL